MINDKWAVGQGLSEHDLSRISWGIGWALQLDADGKPEKAFHWGDYGGDNGRDWTAMVVLDIKKNQGMVFMTDSANGLLLADQIINENTVDLKHGLKFVFEKYGFAREATANWRSIQGDKVSRIIALQEEKIVMNDDKKSCTLSIKCHPTLSAWKSEAIIADIMTAFDKFNAANINGKAVCKVNTVQDDKKNISFLSINIPDAGLYDQFIRQLDKQKLLFILPATPQVAPNQLSNNARVHKGLSVTRSSRESPVVEKDKPDSKTVTASSHTEEKPGTSAIQNAENPESSSYSTPKPPGFSTRPTPDPVKK
jgi:hypothetical protein